MQTQQQLENKVVEILPILSGLTFAEIDNLCDCVKGAAAHTVLPTIPNPYQRISEDSNSES